MRTRPAVLFVLLSLEIVLSNAAGAARGQEAGEWKKRIESAAAGQTIDLPAGEIALAGVKVPAGVVVRGAGYDKTTLAVGSAEVGLSLAGDGAGASNLTIDTHGGTGLLARGAHALLLSGVRVHGGAIGIRLQEIDGARIENCIVDGSLTGIALDHVSGAAVVNNTLVHSDSVGFALTSASRCALFNNLVAHAGVGVSITDPGKQLQIDHNLYLVHYAGKLGTEVPRVSIGPWRDVTGGLDAQSVCEPVEFRDLAKGDYTPVSTLAWNPGMPTTAEWGVKSWNGFNAPDRDISGQQRPEHPGVGAREPATPEPVKTDGAFTIERNEGTKSAGVFRKDGTLVRYLFSDLPLPAGKYGFVLPSRSEMGQAIAAGDYELRLVESNLRISYRMLTGNNGAGPRVDQSDRDSAMRVLLDPDQNLILACGWSERAENLRAKNLATGKATWSVPGSSAILGLCQGSDGLFYAVQPRNKSFAIFRLDRAGKFRAWPNGDLKLPVAIENVNGLAELNGELFVTSTNGEVWRVPVATGQAQLAFKVPGAFSPVADRKRQLLWMISGGQGAAGGSVTAFTPTGELKFTIKAVPNPLGIAINGDRLAIADYDAGKVRFFDISNPADPQARQSIGRGDGPFGLVVPDRFWFQKGRYMKPSPISMDMDSAGRLAVLDGGSRPLVFGPDGKNIYMGFAQFGNAPFWARFPVESGEPDVSRFFDANSRISWTIDARNNTWSPEAYWGRPEVMQGGNATIGFFKYQGKVYGVVRHTTSETHKRNGFLFLRYDDYVGKIVAFYTQGKHGMVVVRDENDDGAITEADGEGEPVLNDAGKSMNPGDVMSRFADLEPNNNLRADAGQLWVFKGIDQRGYPIYEFPAAKAYPIDVKALASPYTFKAGGSLYSQSVVAADGDLIAGMNPPQSPRGVGLSNSGAVDLARFRKDGSLRWYRPLNDYGPIQGVKQVTAGFILTSWGHQAEWIGLDDDGLSLGHLGFPYDAHWGGYWVDHPEHHLLFKGNDGKLHIAVGDYFLNGVHWMSLQNYDNYRKGSYPFTVSEDRATVLAAEPPQTTFLLPRAQKPNVVVKKLSQPLAIDGDLQKWRQLGLSPQIIITPATGTSTITSAGDCSAVIRLAYEGKNLYVQVLRFDDVVTFHQTVASGTQNQDTVEMMINGFFPDGFQFSVGKFSTDGDQIVRRRFFGGKLDRNLQADLAPRIVKVLDNARDVEERKLIEAATGEDLSSAKVIVTEFKLPIDQQTWAGSEKTLFPVESGKGFWLGFMIDDNDVPGSDLQKFEVWPATFNTFAVKEESAWVVFE